MKKNLKLVIGVIAFVAALSAKAAPPIQVDAHVAANGTSTWNITTTHPNELIILSVGGYGTGGNTLAITAGTVKVNGNNATYETRGLWLDPNFSWQADVWAYVAPIAGTYTCTCTEAGLNSPWYFNFATAIYENGCALALGNIFLGGNNSNHGPTTITAAITTPVANCWVYGTIDNNDNGGTGTVAWNGQLSMLNKTYISNGVDGAQADSTYPLAGVYNITSTDLGASNVWMSICLIGVTPNCVLPVQLLNFSCNPADNGIELYWNTATETNSSKFTIERSSDGIEFTPIGDVTAAGNSDLQRSYSWVDENPMPGNNYYRLVETDNDGQSQTFNVSACSPNKVINEVYPNPNQGTFTLSLGASNSTQYLVVYDLTGREVMRQAFNPSTENTTNTISILGGNKGVFMAEILNGDQVVKVKKIVVY